MKQRFSSLDVKIIAHELSNSLVSLRLANIYDLSSKIFLLKFAKPDNKKQLIVDSGFRCHLTSFARTTAAAPSDFCTRLRKYLKTRRCTAVSQIGTDRIIELSFSDGQYRLFFEFYAGGNIILTDRELKIITLLRIVSEPSGEGQEELRVGLEYSLKDRQNFGGVPEVTTERLRQGLSRAVERAEPELGQGKKPKKKGGDELRKALAVSIAEFPPMLVDHAMRVTNFNAKLKPAEVLASEELLEELKKTLLEAQRVVQDITSEETAKGYIIAKRGKHAADVPESDSAKNLLYDDFHPFKPRQFSDDPECVFLPFEGFNVTVDEFFSSIEGQKLESRLQEREATAKRKLEAAKQDQAKRLGGLQEVQALNVRKAAAIEASPERVQEAMDAINGLIAQGMDWVEIGKLIELEQKRKNPVASIIKLPLKLDENTVTLLLDEETYEEEDEDEAYETGSDVSDSEDEAPTKEVVKKGTDSRLTVDIDLGQSPYKNAREYYDQRRVAVVKEQKTLESSTKALKSTQQKIQHDLKKGLKQEKAILRPVRQQMWFEKFIWFLSSDGYMIIGGRDTQKVEILYKKYLRKGDVYVHADVAEAGTMIIRNNDPNAPIPPSTLQQAGIMAVACSTAWDTKANMPAWWVDSTQVSKSTPAGDFLPPGSFNISGTKNFLTPAPLLLGFAVLFQIGESSKAKHGKHRVTDVGAKNSNESEAVIAESIIRDKSRNEDDEDIEGKTDDEDDEEEDNASVKSARSNPLQSTTVIDESTETSEIESPADEAKNSPLDAEAVLATQNLTISDDLTAPPASQAEEAEESDAETDSDNETLAQAQARANAKASSKSKVQPQPAKKVPVQLPRGKKSKAKKAAQKYKDQDEEDRIAAQSLIGASAGKAKAEAEAETRAKKEAEAAFQKERRRAQHLRTLEETKKTEEARKAMLANGDDIVEEDDNDRTVDVESFVGWPLGGDELLEAIPICAPWSALTNYKYKVKLQAGAQKKGKATKEIVERWTRAEQIKGALDVSASDKERVWPREMELLKGWRVEELNNVLPVSKVRIMVTGGASAGGSGGAKGKPRGGRGKKK